MAENWIKDAVKNKGSLRKTLGVKKGKNIPLNLLKKAENSKNPTTRKRAQLAETLRSFKK